MTRTEYTRCDRPGCSAKTKEERDKQWYRVTITYPREGRGRAWDVCSLACLYKLLRQLVDDKAVGMP